MTPFKSGWVLTAMTAYLRALAVLAMLATRAAAATPAPLEFGVDRSNMATEWTMGSPEEPNVSPFLLSEYNKPGDFEARRVAILDGIARTHVVWFRDGFGGNALSIDLLKLVHARGMKMLAIVGPAASDYPPGAQLTKAQSGCPWGTYPLSKLNVGAFQKLTMEKPLCRAKVQITSSVAPRSPTSAM